MPRGSRLPEVATRAARAVAFVAVFVFAVHGSGGNAAAAPVYEVIDLTAGDPAAGVAYAVDDGRVAGVRLSQSGDRATLWPSGQGTPLDLTPAGLTHARVLAAHGGRQAGFALPSGGGEDSHAFLWSGTAASAVDLHPAGFAISLATGIHENQQVGWGIRPGSQWGEALVWNGTAASAVSLHPAGALSSDAWAIWNGQQVGSVLLENRPAHATLWSGRADTAVDLHPPGFGLSIAQGIAGGQQVGYAGFPGMSRDHAMLWSGTAESAVDLHPAGAASSGAAATNGAYQVGGVTWEPGGQIHAALWSGSAGSILDLHALLPAGQFRNSYASGIDAAGNVVGSAFDNDLKSHAILWRAVPEPAGTPAVAACAALSLLRRRSRGRCRSGVTQPRRRRCSSKTGD